LLEPDWDTCRSTGSQGFGYALVEMHIVSLYCTSWCPLMRGTLSMVFSDRHCSRVCSELGPMDYFIYGKQQPPLVVATTSSRAKELSKPFHLCCCSIRTVFFHTSDLSRIGSCCLRGMARLQDQRNSTCGEEKVPNTRLQNEFYGRRVSRWRPRI
jgi:hypothetical protein